MAEYIKREDVLRHKRKMSGADFGGEFWDEAVLCEDIRKIPTADVVEVMHSRWENISGFEVCNICGTSPAYCEPKPNNPKGYPPYCHNCGAKMDAERKEGD